MSNTFRSAGRLAAFAAILSLCLSTSDAAERRARERLDRGVVALRQADGKVFIGWRLLADDPEGAAFNVYRTNGSEKAARLNQNPLAGATHFVDQQANQDRSASYFVRRFIDGREDSASKPFLLQPGSLPYLSIPLQTPAGYRPNDASVGDLDGDGAYEIVLHQAGRSGDNSRPGFTDPPILEAYRLDGTFMWRINLGRNIREGAHYTQFMVYDLDGDGRAEVACKTADGTRDGLGQSIGDADADWREQTGRTRGKILTGPEFLTVFDGLTGAALATTRYLPGRGNIESWGDDYGNRCDRFLACVAYLDGARPSLVMCRGYYKRSVLAAWDWRNGKLKLRWVFDSDDGTPAHRDYRGQGNHSLAVADVDEDGRDEIIYGSCVIDDDGTGLYSTGLGHGDAMHVTDIDPLRPGLEVFKANGDRANEAGIELRDARTGERLFGRRSTGERGVPRACAMDIDPGHPGLELWGKGRGVEGLFNARGKRISRTAPRSCNMGVWWDGDLLRELLDGTRVYKWNYKAKSQQTILDSGLFNCVRINGSKSNPSLCADILGDWREEIIWPSRDGKELRIFTTTIPTGHRLATLMHDPVYRLSVAWQNVGYNQPAHPGFFLGISGD